jgi:hypothetical protein
MNTMVDAVDRLSARFLTGCEALFAGRCAHGRVVDAATGLTARGPLPL